MSFKTFLDLVEIKTKVAALFPFIIGILFALFRFGEINILNTIVFFASMFIFDMTTTAINNFMDYFKATDKHNYDYRKTKNIIGQAQIPESLVRNVILLMLTAAAGLGLYLVTLTNIVVLFTGIVCFAVGIFYTFGPIPLSRMPLGELFSGVTMGLGITFLAVYINNPYIIIFEHLNGIVNISINIKELGIIFLIAIPSVLTIACLMLANNICDLREDILNNRFTLPYYIGKSPAIVLFELMYYVAYISIIIAIFLGVHSIFMPVALATFFPVFKNLLIFRKEQEKSSTFVIAVKNLILVNGGVVSGLVIYFLWNRTLILLL